MEKDDKQRAPRLEVLDTAAEILGNHGKNDDEIRAFLEKQFPVSTAIMEKILKTRKNRKVRGNRPD